MIHGPKKSVTILLPLELYQRLKVLSLESSRTLPAYIRQILKLYLRRLEDHPDDPDDWWSLS